MSVTALQQIDLDEAVRLGAVDTEFFGKFFFPKAMRDESASFSRQLWDALENPALRHVNMEVFRGGAKTTRLRVFTAKRIAYGISRTVLYVGPREDLATRSVQWLRSQIEPRVGADGVARPSPFATAFGLVPGKKWQEHEFEVVSTITGQTTWVMGVGITGTIRGINFDDYRPDLIVCDDLMTDENSQTSVATTKIVDLVLGAVKNSLAPETEAPNAKLVHLCTPLNQDDLSAHAKKSPEWHSESFGCWTEATKDLPTEKQESSWPTRYPSETLRSEKRAAILDHKYSIFAREKECKRVSVESRLFLPAWLRVSDDFPDPHKMLRVLSIDPVPPPSAKQLEKQLIDKDFEAIGVIGRMKDDYYLLDYVMNKGHDPSWTKTMTFQMARQWGVARIVIEAIAYQRVLKWLLEEEMKRIRTYYAINTRPDDKRAKIIRISDVLHGVASQGHLWARPHHTEAIFQFENIGPGYTGHDDLIDMWATGVQDLSNQFIDLDPEEYYSDVQVPKLRAIRRCP